MLSWTKNTFTIVRENVLGDHIINHNWKEEPIHERYEPMNLFLQLKVCDENNFKAKSIELTSFKMQLLSQYYNIQVEIWKDDS